MPWSVCRSEPQRESVAQRHLQLAGFETYLPVIRATRAFNGHALARPASWVEPLFRSYLFVNIPGQWHVIQRSIGVAGLLMTGEQPASVSDRVIAELRARERNGLVELPKPPTFRRGESIRIIKRGHSKPGIALCRDMNHASGSQYCSPSSAANAENWSSRGAM